MTMYEKPIFNGNKVFWFWFCFLSFLPTLASYLIFPPLFPISFFFSSVTTLAFYLLFLTLPSYLRFPSLLLLLLFLSPLPHPWFLSPLPHPCFLSLLPTLVSYLLFISSSQLRSLSPSLFLCFSSLIRFLMFPCFFPYTFAQLTRIPDLIMLVKTIRFISLDFLHFRFTSSFHFSSFLLLPYSSCFCSSYTCFLRLLPTFS